MSSDSDVEWVRTLHAAALCLRYPDADLLERLPLLRAVADAAPEAIAAPLARFVEHLATTPEPDLARDYVETFDLRRRCCLYLTYYAYGDTRKRGMALLEFTSAYRSCGAQFLGEELPDHLAVICEFAAAHPAEGLRLFRRHRAGVELLRLALAEASSPYVDVVDAIRAVLPDPAPRDLDRALELARTGPPAEEVGLEPFAPPEYMGGRR